MIILFLLSHVFQYAAAAISNANANLFSLPQYPLNLATALATAHTKNSSIADLRLKAKRHVESLGINENLVQP